MDIQHITSPFTLVIFGASGDLAHLMLFPGLYELAEQKRFPADFHVVGFARTAKSDEEFRKEFAESVRKKYGQQTDENILEALISHVHYFQGEYDDVESFVKLQALIETGLKPVSTENNQPSFGKVAEPAPSMPRGARDERGLESKQAPLQSFGQPPIRSRAGFPQGSMTLVAYFSVPPSAFKPIIANLAATRKSNEDDIRLVLEKPFGSDLRSAEDLIYFTLNHFREESLFLLDHYLGKSAVRSLVSLRRHNRILDLLIEGQQIDNIQITAVEKDGIKNRIGYFDQVGTIKDFVQSHLLQLIAITAMDMPVSESASSFQREKNSILSALCFEPKPENACIGQYASYRQADLKVKDSTTETFVALKMGIDRENWFDVPVYLRTGKGLDAKRTYITVEFKKLAFQDAQDPPNRLVIELHPEEKVSLALFTDSAEHPSLGKVSGTPDGRGSSRTLLALSSSLACVGDDCLPPHALFLLDVFLNRRMFFLSFPEVVAAWKLTERILSFAHPSLGKVARTRDGRGMFLNVYPDGSEGPVKAKTIIEQDGRKWFEGEHHLRF